ncbi:hypothetical protein K0M31_005890 [Melipona bicolor]|uniref:Uncharacterized protein n=1 Tax=Melipona bicolor TaxID=60889 RepID=A0AA40FUB1_9HYME|nr:hypothetical protein K0M31_005890 [Melipona bicolor]
MSLLRWEPAGERGRENATYEAENMEKEEKTRFVPKKSGLVLANNFRTAATKTGVHFDTSTESLVSEITTAVKVYAYGAEDFLNNPVNKHLSLNTQLSCEGSYGESRWDTGDLFFKYLKNVSVEGDQGKPNVEFTQDGVLKAAELKIMNLRPGLSKQLVWEERPDAKDNEESKLENIQFLWRSELTKRNLRSDVKTLHQH